MTRREFLRMLGLFAALPFIGLRGGHKPTSPKMSYRDKVVSYGPIDFWPLDEDKGTVAYCSDPAHNGNYVSTLPKYLMTTKENEATVRAIIESTWGTNN